jgi:FAD:protein FMN transferase
MGTAVSFDIRDAPYQGEASRVLHRATAWLHRIDAIFSTFRADSELSRLQRGELGPAERSPEMVEVLGLASECQERTQGTYRLCWRRDGVPDPTGIVKGWAVDRASLILATSGVPDHLVSSAGHIRLSGHPEPDRVWTTGIAHPHQLGLLVAAVNVTDIGMATWDSAQPGRRTTETPTESTAEGVASVTVIGVSSATAYGYAVGAVNLGADARSLLQPLDGQGWPSLLVTDDGKVWASPGFPGRVYPEGIKPDPR